MSDIRLTFVNMITSYIVDDCHSVFVCIFLDFSFRFLDARFRQFGFSFQFLEL